MSLLRELQDITERTYRQTSGINLEHFIIDRRRFQSLSDHCGNYVSDLSEAARVFLRKKGEQLYLGLYFSPDLIDALECNDPRRGLNEQNIEPFMVFIEEINHGVHAAIKFLRGENEIGCEDFVRDLELMAKIDSYQILKFFLAYFNPANTLQNFDRLWIKHHLFERTRTDCESPVISRRYSETNHLGEKYTRYLDGLSSEDRLIELRQLQSMSYPSKASYIRMLP